MKLYIIIALVIGVALGLLVMKSCSIEGDLEATVNNLKDRLKTEQTVRESKELEIVALEKKVDSLAVIKQRTKREIVYRTAQIDSAILKDSSNSLVEYRRSLQDNDYLPDGTLYLSYREIGLGAILMAKVPKLELQVNICEEQLTVKDQIIDEHKFIEKSYERSMQIQKLETQRWQQAYEKESAWYNENWIWLTLGIVVTGGIVAVSGGFK